MEATKSLACCQNLAMNLLKATGSRTPKLAQLVIVAGERLMLPRNKVNEVLDQINDEHGLRALVNFLERPQFKQGALSISLSVDQDVKALSTALIGSEQGKESILSAMEEVIKTQFSAMVCSFGPAGAPVTDMRQKETCGANPHFVYLVDRTDGGSVFLKDAPMEVEQYGIKLVGLVGIEQYRVQQVGEWGVIEPLVGVTIDKIEQSTAAMRGIGFGCGRYFAASWAFGIVERDDNAANILIDPQTFVTRHIDFEVILCPTYADLGGVANDIDNVLRFCRGAFIRPFLEGLIKGFVNGCASIQKNKQQAMELVDRAFAQKVEIGFTGHEPGGIINSCITGNRKPLPLFPDDQQAIETRINEIADGNQNTWPHIVEKILTFVPKR